MFINHLKHPKVSVHKLARGVAMDTGTQLMCMYK